MLSCSKLTFFFFFIITKLFRGRKKCNALFTPRPALYLYARIYIIIPMVQTNFLLFRFTKLMDFLTTKCNLFILFLLHYGYNDAFCTVKNPAYEINNLLINNFINSTLYILRIDRIFTCGRNILMLFNY